MSDLKRGLFGYRTASVRVALAEQERMFRRASMDAQSADERAERLASELWETQRRLEATEETLSSAREAGGQPGDGLAADLERSVAQRETMEAEGLALRNHLTELRATLEAADSAIAGKDEELRLAAERTAALDEELRRRDEQLIVTQEGASKARGWLLRALEETAG